MKKKLVSVSLALTLSLIGLTGCNTYTEDSSKGEETATSVADSTSNGDTSSASQTKTTVNVAGGVAITLNQFTSQASNDFDAFYLLMSSLFRYYDGSIQNDACEDYEVSEDGITYTFYLRDDLTYSDGTEVSSEDFAFALETILGPESGSATGSNYMNIKGATAYSSGEADWESVGVSTPDEKTLVIELETADQSFVTILATSPFYPITREFAEQWGDSLGSSPESIMCSGPYTLAEWTLESSMTFNKNPNWWNADNEFPMETINILNISSPNTKVSMFENGELDIISVVDSNYIATIDEFVESYESSTEMFLWIKEVGTSDEATEVLKNDNFRKALTYALDRTAISGAVNAGFIGTNRAVSGNYPGIEGKYVDEYPVDVIGAEGDADKAVEYMDKALEELGYNDVSELPEMSYITFERDDMKLLGETIVDTWKQVLGIDNITFIQYPIGTAIQQFYTGQYDLFMISLGCSVRPTEIIESFTPTGDYAFFIENWSTDITELLEEANAMEFRSDEYYKKVAEAENALLNEYSLVPIYNQTVFYALADGVEGYVEPGTVFNYQFNHLEITK